MSLAACEARPAAPSGDSVASHHTPLTIDRDEPPPEHNGILSSKLDNSQFFGTLHLVASINQGDRSSDSVRLMGAFYERPSGSYMQVGVELGFEGLMPGGTTLPRTGSVQRYDSTNPSNMISQYVARISARKTSDGETEVILFVGDNDSGSETILEYRGLLFVDCQLLQDDENLIGASTILSDRMFASVPCAEFARWASDLTNPY